MRIVPSKPEAPPLLSGELTFEKTNAAVVRVLIELFPEMVQPDFTTRLMILAARDNVLMQRVRDLKDREVLVTLDSLRESASSVPRPAGQGQTSYKDPSEYIPEGTVVVRYTAYPGDRLDGRR